MGDARVGIAQSDLDGIIASPVDTFARETSAAQLQRHIVETGASRIYVGLPRNMDGSEGAAASKARAFIDELCALEPLEGEGEYEVFLIDERLTTVSAHRALSASGRRMKNHRSVVDQVAAVMILQSALDQEKARGTTAGEQWFPEDE